MVRTPPFQGGDMSSTLVGATMCKHCKKDKEMAKGYIICFDCLIELDINHKNYKRYEVNENR